MSVRTSVDFIGTDRLETADRGLTYGDGLFETLRVVGDVVPLWSRHVERLSASAARLRLPAPDTDAMLAEVRRLADGLDDAVARITFTAGLGPRGYARPGLVSPTTVIGVGPLSLAPDGYRDGIALRLCDTRLGDQPLLAGMKHLNRLEQVLARSEWDDARWQEGLMADLQGRIVCATAANLFAVRDGRLVTPPGSVLLPGLVDLHVHAPQWPQLGTGLDLPLERWLFEYTFPLEARYADLVFARPVWDASPQGCTSFSPCGVQVAAFSHSASLGRRRPAHLA